MKYFILIILSINLYCKSTIYYIEKYSNKYKVDMRIIQSLIKKESNGKLNAVSKMNAQGLGQIMLETARDYYKDLKKNSDKSKIREYYTSVIMLNDKLLAYHIKNEKRNIAITCWNIRRCLNYYRKKYKRNYDNYIFAINSHINGCNGSWNGKFSFNYVNSIINNVINFK